MLKIFLLVAATLLSGCVAYPGYYSAYPAYPAAPAYPVQQPGQGAQGRALRDVQGLRQRHAARGTTRPKRLDQRAGSQNCTTKWICQ